jgi:hypothetical protein
MSFIETGDGTYIFFPYGSWGKGRIVNSEEIYQKLLLHQYIWCAFLGAITPIILKLSENVTWHIAAIGFPIVVLLYYVATQIITRNLPYSPIRLKFERKALSHNFSVGPYTGIFLIISGIIIALFGAIIILSYKQTGGHVFLGIVTVGLGFLSGGWGLRCIIKRNPSDISDGIFDE